MDSAGEATGIRLLCGDEGDPRHLVCRKCGRLLRTIQINDQQEERGQPLTAKFSERVFSGDEPATVRLHLAHRGVSPAPLTVHLESDKPWLRVSRNEVALLPAKPTEDPKRETVAVLVDPSDETMIVGQNQGEVTIRWDRVPGKPAQATARFEVRLIPLVVEVHVADLEINAPTGQLTVHNGTPQKLGFRLATDAPFEFEPPVDAEGHVEVDPMADRHVRFGIDYTDLPEGESSHTIRLMRRQREIGQATVRVVRERVDRTQVTTPIGIDFGMSYSCICKYDQDQSIPISLGRAWPIDEETFVIPTEVAVPKELGPNEEWQERAEVGWLARRTAQQEPGRWHLIADIKRRMVEEETLAIGADGQRVPAHEVGAVVVRWLLAQAARDLGKEPDAEFRVVCVTCPANWPQPGLEGTDLMAAEAGIPFDRTLGTKTTGHSIGRRIRRDEPVAAAQSARLNTSQSASNASGAATRRWVIVDWGGGTFDVAILDVDEGQVDGQHGTPDAKTVVVWKGEAKLGGRDIDEVIAQQIVLPELKRQHGVELELPRLGARLTDEETARRADFNRSAILLLAEQLKIEANERGIAAGAYRLGVFADGEELTEHELDLTLERRQLDTLIEPLVAQAMEQVAEALNVEKAPSGGAEGLPGNLVEGPRDLIVLKVGGSSQLKLFEERLNELVGVGKVWNHQRPELAVGMGAAELVVKYPQRPEEGDFPARYPVGIRMKGDVFQEFIKADERCPVECSLPLSAEDDPLQVSVYEYTGSSRDVRAGEQAGEEVRVYPSPLTPGEDYSLVGWYEIRGFRGRGGIFDLTLGISAEREVTVKASQKTAEGSRHELTVEGQGRPIRDD